jgi:hypothetical protein
MMEDINGVLMGMMEPEEAEEVSNQIWEGWQARGGLVGNVQHESDGDEPTTIYALGGEVPGQRK